MGGNLGWLIDTYLSAGKYPKKSYDFQGNMLMQNTTSVVPLKVWLFMVQANKLVPISTGLANVQ